MEYRLNSRTFGYYREDRMDSMMKDDQRVVRAEKMAEKKHASSEAEKVLKENLKKAITMIEGAPRVAELMGTLESCVFSQRMNAYGKLNRCMDVLKDLGIDVESGLWQCFLQENKKTISQMTDPNKFYTY